MDTVLVNGPRALIKRLDGQQLTSNVIEVVRYEEAPSQFALVVAAGNGARLANGTRRPMEIKAGDAIILKAYCGVPVTIKGEDLFMVVEDDILAVLESTPS